LHIDRLNHRRFLADQPAGSEEDENDHKRPTEHIPTPTLQPLKETQRNAAGKRKVPERERDGGSVFPAPADGFGGADQPGDKDGKKGLFLGHSSKKLKHGFILVVLRGARIGGGKVGMGTAHVYDDDPCQGSGEQKAGSGRRCPENSERRNKSEINRVGPEADANPDNRRAGDQQKAAKSGLRAKALA